MGGGLIIHHGLIIRTLYMSISGRPEDEATRVHSICRIHTVCRYMVMPILPTVQCIIHAL